MVMNFNTKNFFDGFLYALNARVAKLNHFAGIGHNDVVMLLVKIRFFVMALVLAKLVAPYQAAFQQEFYSVIQRGAAYTVVFIFHFDVQRFYIKMLLAVVYFLQYCIALRSFPVAFVFQKFGEDIFYNILVFIIIHGFMSNTRKDTLIFLKYLNCSKMMKTTTGL